jgi:hypothetical protein
MKLALPNHTNYINALYLQILVFMRSWYFIFKVANNKVRNTNIIIDVSKVLTASNVQSKLTSLWQFVSYRAVHAAVYLIRDPVSYPDF